MLVTIAGSKASVEYTMEHLPHLMESPIVYIQAEEFLVKERAHWWLEELDREEPQLVRFLPPGLPIPVHAFLSAFGTVDADQLAIWGEALDTIVASMRARGA